MVLCEYDNFEEEGCLFPSTCYYYYYHQTMSITSIGRSDPIADIFSKHLPCIPFNVADDFSRGMRLYHAAFKEQQDTAMSYETLPEYQASIFITRVSEGGGEDRFWPFTPNFKKIAALAIQYLFKTEITLLSDSVITMSQTIVFVDRSANRWIMTVGEVPSCKIYMYFPRSKTSLINSGYRPAPVEELIDPSSHSPEGHLPPTTANSIMLYDIKHWSDGKLLLL